MTEEGEERLFLLIDGEKKYLNGEAELKQAPDTRFSRVEVDSEY